MELSTIMTLLVCAMIIHTEMVPGAMVMPMPVDILMKNRKVIDYLNVPELNDWIINDNTG